MEFLTKKERRVLRSLAALAYERELASELGELFQDFIQWKDGEVNPFELSDRVHKFHNGKSRTLYSFYNTLSEDTVVARAIVNGVLGPEDVPKEIANKLERKMEFYRVDFK